MRVFISLFLLKVAIKIAPLLVAVLFCLVPCQFLNSIMLNYVFNSRYANILLFQKGGGLNCTS